VLSGRKKIREWKATHNEEVQDTHNSPNVSRVIMLRKMVSAGHEHVRGGKRNA